VSEIYEFIDAEYATCDTAPGITRMCAWLDVSKSGFYDWKSRPESATAGRRKRLALIIKRIFDDSDSTTGTGGSPGSWPGRASSPGPSWSAG
jgi:hypothetical protein